MAVTQGTPRRLPPPPTERERGAGPIILFLIGVVAFLAAFGVLNNSDPEDGIKQLGTAILLGLIGTTLLIVAAIYDNIGRPRR